MSLLSIFRSKPQDKIAAQLYFKIAEHARDPAFYTDFGVADELEGRFEVLALHLFLLMRRLKTGSEETADQRADLAQRLFDTFFKAMDDVHRQMGVGDMSVARKVRAMAEAFYGRAAAYDEALHEDADSLAIARSLSRNVYGIDSDLDEPPITSKRLAGYVSASALCLDEQTDMVLLAGNVDFPVPKEMSS